LIPGRGSNVNFLFAIAWRPALGATRPPIQEVSGVKRPGCEADHWYPSSAEVKNALPTYDFMAWCLVTWRDNFTFTFRLGLVSLVRWVLVGLSFITVDWVVLSWDRQWRQLPYTSKIFVGYAMEQPCRNVFKIWRVRDAVQMSS